MPCDFRPGFGARGRLPTKFRRRSGICLRLATEFTRSVKDGFSQPPIAMRVRMLAIAAAICLLARAAPLAAQATTRSDSDPTAPIFFSVRPEYSSIAPDVSRLVLIARYDAAVFADRQWLPGRRALLLRFEVPIAGLADAGRASASGGGDAYAQALSVLWRWGRVAVVAARGCPRPRQRTRCSAAVNGWSHPPSRQSGSSAAAAWRT